MTDPSPFENPTAKIWGFGEQESVATVPAQHVPPLATTVLGNATLPSLPVKDADSPLSPTDPAVDRFLMALQAAQSQSLGIATPGHTPRSNTPELPKAFDRIILAGWTTATKVLEDGASLATVLPPLADSNTSLPPPTIPAPSGRFGHTAVATGNMMIVYGGRQDELVEDDLWTATFRRDVPEAVSKGFSLSPQITRVGAPTGALSTSAPSGPPSMAIGQSLTLDPSPSANASHSISFGAGSNAGLLLQSESDVPTYVEWKRIVPTSAVAPSARAGHTAVLSNGGLMIVFAGGDHQPPLKDDVWILDIATWAWSQVPRPATAVELPATIRDDQELGYTDADANLWPHARKGHTAVYDAEKNEMLVFGGLLSTRRPTFDNHVWGFSAETGKWKLHHTTGTRPSSRMYHVAEFDSVSRKMFLFGGRLLLPNLAHPFLDDLHEYCPDSGVWTKIVCSNAPSPRMCSASLMFNGRFAVVQGGSQVYVGDCHEYDIKKREWRALPDAAGPRTRPTVVHCANNVILFGGCLRTEYHDDARVLQLKPPTLSELCHEWLDQLAYVDSGHLLTQSIALPNFEGDCFGSTPTPGQSASSMVPADFPSHISRRFDWLSS